MAKTMRGRFLASPSGEAAARRRLMRGRFANTVRLRAAAETQPLIRLRAGPQTPSPKGEGFQWYSLAVTASRFGAWAPLAFCDRCA